jgi:hypothetical protein
LQELKEVVVDGFKKFTDACTGNAHVTYPGLIGGATSLIGAMDAFVNSEIIYYQKIWFYKVIGRGELHPDRWS